MRRRRRRPSIGLAVSVSVAVALPVSITPSIVVRLALVSAVAVLLGDAVLHSLARTVIEDALFVLIDFPLLLRSDVAARNAHAPVPLLGLYRNRITLRRR